MRRTPQRPPCAARRWLRTFHNTFRGPCSPPFGGSGTVGGMKTRLSHDPAPPYAGIALDTIPRTPSARPDAVPLLYVGGCGRSGSTLLDRMLGQVPNVCSLGEIGHLWKALGTDQE